MKDVKRAQDLIGSEVYDPHGEKIGRVGNVYVDDATHQPEWVTVRTGLFGMKESFVPLSGASADQNRINVDVTKERVKDAPRIDVDNGHLSDQEGQDLYTYYGVSKDTGTSSEAEAPAEESGAGGGEEMTGHAAAAGGMAPPQQRASQQQPSRQDTQPRAETRSSDDTQPSMTTADYESRSSDKYAGESGSERSGSRSATPASASSGHQGESEYTGTSGSAQGTISPEYRATDAESGSAGSGGQQPRYVPGQQSERTSTSSQAVFSGPSTGGMDASGGSSAASGSSGSATMRPASMSPASAETTSAAGSESTTTSPSGSSTMESREPTERMSQTAVDEQSSDTRGTGQRSPQWTATAPRSGEQTHQAAETSSMTRSEERLAVGTETVETGRVRLRKYVVTEHQTVTVPVSHEEIRIERESVEGAEAEAMPSSESSSSIGEDQQEIILRAERPVVRKEAVPVERIKFNTETVTEERTVEGDVRQERFDIDDDSGRHRRQQM